MTFELATMDRQAVPQRRGALALAGLTAALGWISLAIEGYRSLTSAMAHGHRLGEAVFLYLHFFTILTNLGVAVLMSVTVARRLAQRPLPPAGLYNASLVYMLVTCVTYEAVLRSKWAPHGMQFFTDFAIHDIIPALTLVFWIAFAPRAGACWRDARRMLVYPVLYFAMTLAAGALGEGYPYNFFDVTALGLPTVLIVGTLFLVVFYLLGLATTALSMGRPRGGAG